MKLYNTLSKNIETLREPDKNKPITLYTCGPTVYDETHIGHMRKYTMDDTLKRTLKYLGYEVNHVMNITDVGHLSGDDDTGEDKLEKGAKKQGKTVWDVAKYYTDKFFETMDALNIIRPDKVVKATEHIKQMIDLVKHLEEKGFTYQTDEAVYFDVTKFRAYGRLSGQRLEEKKQAARGDVYVDPGKKHPADFALWFKRVGRFKDHTMHWESAWGDGFPGWHIECSAMSMAYLGETIDIHTGGIDHIPVHHENEIAQSEAATGKKFVNFWVHHAFLQVENEKMSKSKENYFTLEDLRKHNIDPLAMRYLFLQTHYRQEMNFTWKAAKAAQEAYFRLRDYYIRIQSVVNNLLAPEFTGNKLIEINNTKRNFLHEFNSFISEDLNTSRALGTIWNLVGSELPEKDKKELLEKFDEVLGFNFKDLDEIKLPSHIQDLKVERDDFRIKKDYIKADEIKTELNKLGYEVQDSAIGTIVIPGEKKK